MKKVFGILVLFSVFLLAGVAAADLEQPINITISTTDWTELTLTDPPPLKTWLIQTRDGAGFLWKKTHTGASDPYWTIKDDFVYQIEYNRERQKTSLGWVKLSAPGVIEILPKNEN